MTAKAVRRFSALLTAIVFLVCSGCATRMPRESGTFLPSDLVEIVRLDSSIRLDIRYATTNNFTNRIIYTKAGAYLQRPAAEALAHAHQALKPKGYGLLVFDGYRPWQVTKLFWKITPKKDREFVADPRKGSRHNRGCAVDLTLYDLRTGQAVKMPGEYDEASERSYADYKGGSEAERKARDLLRSAMETNGFTVLHNEWWHFDYRDWRSYSLLDMSFEELFQSPAP
jgi:D-alanyl-D-alanine dipeptidase